MLAVLLLSTSCGASFSHINAQESKFDAAVKKVTDQSRTTILAVLLAFTSLMLYTRIQHRSFLGFGEEDF